MIKKWKDIMISPDITILQTMRIIDEASLQFAVVVDEDRRLLGTVTDGDIRRGILKGLSLNSSVKEVMNCSPIHEKDNRKPYYYKELMKIRRLKQLPIVNENKQVQHIFFIDNLNQEIHKDNVVVLMAGGLGTRLRPLTNDIPKPMLKVGDKPILETILESFKSFGFHNFIISVNYKKDIIKDYFQDGSHFGVNIDYIEEAKRLGTAGALSLLKDKLNKPFFVMNGDILTKINYEQLLDFYTETNSLATMCVREYEFQIPYGVIETNNHKLLSIEEKPIHKNFVNAGIYVLSPEILNYIPENEYYDMPDLFKKFMGMKKNVSAFPLREYWLDIGRELDYEKANVEYTQYFTESDS